MKPKRKFTSVSVDGSEPAVIDKNSESELFEKKLKKNIGRNAVVGGHSSDRNETVDSEPPRIVVDKRTEESECLIREFLKIPQGTQIDHAFVVEKFLELIVNYMKLRQLHEKTAGQLARLRAGYEYSLHDAAPSWN